MRTGVGEEAFEQGRRAHQSQQLQEAQRAHRLKPRRQHRWGECEMTTSRAFWRTQARRSAASATGTNTSAATISQTVQLSAVASASHGLPRWLLA